MNIKDIYIYYKHTINYFIRLSPYVGNAEAMPSLLIRDSYVFNSANASSGVRVTCAPVRRDTGLRDYCFADCKHKASHVPGDEIPADKKVAYDEFLVICRQN